MSKYPRLESYSANIYAECQLCHKRYTQTNIECTCPECGGKCIWWHDPYIAKTPNAREKQPYEN